MITTVKDFYSEAQVFAHAFNKFVDHCKLKGKAKADHICFKCDSGNTFEEMRRMFEDEESEFIYQSIIAGRRIACIQLRKAVSTTLGPIRLLELSDKKPGKDERNHFDHIEIYPTGITYNDMRKCVEKAGIELLIDKRPHHTTHDAIIDTEFKLRLTREPLLEKILRDEINKRKR